MHEQQAAGPRLRLLFVADLQSLHTRRWVSYFAARGHAVLVMSPVAVKLPGVRVKRILRTPTLPKLVQLLNVFAVLAAVVSFRPHVLHAHYARIYGWFAALSFFRPLVVTVWGGDVLADQGAFADFLGKRLTPFTIMRANLVTAHSEFLRARVMALGKPGAFVRMIGCPGVDRKLFRPRLDTGELRRELGLCDAPVVICPRIIDTLYNTEVIVRAVATVVEELPGVKFIFSEHMGNTAHVADMKTLAKNLGVQRSTLFLRTILHERMPLFLNLASVMVSIPDSDGMPQSLLEAMACGTPAVVSALPQYEGVVFNETNALTVNQKDPAAVADAILRLLKDEAFSARISQSAIGTVADGMDYETEMAKMERVYYELARDT